MFKLFKNLRIGYIITSSVLVAIYAVLSFWLALFTDTYTSVFGILTITMWIEIFLVMLVFNIPASKKYNKIIEILNNECDPIKYLNTYYPLTEVNVETKLKPTILLNLATGYIAVGDYQQARNVLASIDLRKSKPIEKIIFYCHITILNIYEGNFDEAGKSLDYVTMLIGTSKIPSKYIETINTTRNLYAANIKIENGYFDDVEQVLNGIISKPACMNQKISAKYTLAKLYIKQNRLNEAINEMTFVAENGNTLAIAQKAREFLNNRK